MDIPVGPCVVVLAVDLKDLRAESQLALRVAKHLHHDPPVVPNLIVLRIFLRKRIHEIQLLAQICPQGSEAFSAILPVQCMDACRIEKNKEKKQAHSTQKLKDCIEQQFRCKLLPDGVVGCVDVQDLLSQLQNSG